MTADPHVSQTGCPSTVTSRPRASNGRTSLCAPLLALARVTVGQAQ